MNNIKHIPIRLTALLTVRPTVLLTVLLAVLPILLTVTFSACEKVEIPQKEDTPTNTPSTPQTPSTPSTPENPESPSTPDTPDLPVPPSTSTLQDTLNHVESAGETPENAFTVADFKTYIPIYFEHNRDEVGLPLNLKYKHVRGYIVGFIPKNKRSLTNTRFSTANAVESNIVIADSPDEIDPSQCIAIELPNSSQANKDTRQALNLATHPENLHRQVIIFGNITHSYMGTYGLKNASAYLFPTP